MNDDPHPIFQLLQTDLRYQLHAYQFVRDSLAYAQEVLPNDKSESKSETENEPHLTGQQLCEAIRLFAIDQFGYMSKTVLNNWGIEGTDDFGEIVYNLIRVDLMKKSGHDRREDFDAVFDFEMGLDAAFEFNAVDGEIEL